MYFACNGQSLQIAQAQETYMNTEMHAECIDAKIYRLKKHTQSQVNPLQPSPQSSPRLSVLPCQSPAHKETPLILRSDMDVL